MIRRLPISTLFPYTTLFRSNDRRTIELMNSLLFSLPGTPVLYYGDEIGMGDNFYLGDRNGVRTPMQWSADKNAGFSRANPQRLYLPVIVDPLFHYEAVNVEAQQGNPHSLLWWTRRLIALRKRHPAFSRGTIEFLQPQNHRVLAFLRRTAEETLLVMANLSRFAQHAELDLASRAGLTPVELFGGSPFPQIGAGGWGVTLGPHSFLWFSLVQDPSRVGPAVAAAAIPVLAVAAPWTSVLEGKARRELETALLDVLPSRRWFGDKTGTLRGVEIVEIVELVEIAPLAAGAVLAVLAVIRADFKDAEPEVYALPLAFAPDGDGKRLERLRQAAPSPVVARLESDSPEGTGLLYDPVGEPGVDRLLQSAIERGERFRGERAELVATPSPALRELGSDRLSLKLFRKLEPGVNPDLEIGRLLTEQTDFRHAPRVAGWLELRDRRSEPVTAGILQEFVPNEGDAWSYTLDALGRYFLRVLTGWGEGERGPAEVPAAHLVELAAAAPGPQVFDRIGTYLPAARLLGERTAELHLALASGRGRDFAPEPFSELYQPSP